MAIATGQVTITDLNESYVGMLSNDAHTVSTLADGTGGVYTSVVSTIKVLLGSVDDTANWTVTATPVTGVTGTLSSKTYTVTNMTVDTGYVDMTATKAGQTTIVKRFTITKSKQGVQGTPATQYYTWIKYADTPTTGISDLPTGKLYMGIAINKTTATESSVYADYTWSLIQGDKGLKGDAGSNGLPTYTWLKYADSPTTGMSDIPTGKIYMGLAYNKSTDVESLVYTDYEWSLIQGEKGLKGDQGEATYTWIKYADSPTTGMDDLPTGKLYMGIAYNKTTSTKSLVYADYSWSLIKGDKGDTGLPATQYYTWLKYADSPTTGMTDTPTGKAYIGLAYNKTTATESSVYADYTWSLIQGAKGDTGDTGATTYTWVKYATSATGTGISDSPTGMTYIGLAYNKLTSTASAVTTDYQWSLIKGTDGINAITYYTWIKYADSPTTGINDLPTGKAYIGIAHNKTVATESSVYADYTWSLIKGADALPNYTWIKYGDSPTTGMNDSPVGKTYIGIAHNKTTATESVTYADYTWSLIKGDQGVQGDPTYTWVKYADDGIGTGMVDAPEGKRYLGLAYNKSTPTESVVPADYTWSPLFDNVVVGGRNTILNSNFATASLDKWSNNGAVTYASIDGKNTALMGTSAGIYQVASNEAVIYTYSFLAKALDTTTSANVGFLNAGVGASKNFTLTMSWAKYKFTTTVPVASGQLLHIYSTGKAYYITDIQVEKGNVATDYTTAPEDKENLYTWIKYSTVLAGTSPSDDPTGRDYIGIAYNKSSAMKSITPADYTWSLYRGATGLKGDTTYTWIKYADSPTTGMVDTPAGKTYIGIAYNKATATESSVYADYSWSLIKGADGTTTYTWVKYATSATGTGIQDSPTNMTYIGMAFNKTTSTASAVPTDYTWSLIKGADGTDGLPTYTWVKYGTSSAGAGINDSPTGMTYIGLAYNKTTQTESTVATDYTWSLIKGDKGDVGETNFTWIKYATSATGTGISDSPTGMTYIGLAYNKTTATESTVTTDYTWSLIKGTDGLPSYTWIKYADTPTTGMSDTPTSKLYIGIAHNKTTATESSVYADYAWSLIKGDKGDAGLINLVNNPHNSGNITGWGAVTYGTDTFADGRTIGVGNIVSTASTMATHVTFSIEPQKMYEFTVWLKQSVTKGTNYFGIYSYNTAMTNIGTYTISNSTGVKTGTLNTNGYFWSGTVTANVWQKHTGYIIPAGYDTSDVEKFRNLGENVTTLFQFPADANFATMRVLNYNNTVSTTLTMGLPMVKEVDVSVLEANRAKNLSEDSKGRLNNAVTTIDVNGVTVKDGNFTLEDSKTGTKYTADTKRNLVKDHGFELLQDDGQFTTFGSLFKAKNPQNDSGVGWDTIGIPYVRPNYDIDGNTQWIMFGNKSVVVDNGNRYQQDIPVVPLVNYPYAISFYATAPKESAMVKGIPQLVVEWWTGGALSSTETKNFAIPTATIGTKERLTGTFLVPNALTYNTDSFMRVYVRTTVANQWVEVDGFQVVEGNLSTTYADESSVWELTAGQQIAEFMRIRSLEADTVSAMTKMFTIDMDIMGNLNLYSQTDASANSTSHAFTIGNNITGASLKMDANEISTFNGSVGSELHVNPDGGRVVFNNNAVGGNVVIEGGGIKLTNAKQANTYNLATIRDGYEVHDEHMMIQNIVVGVPTGNLTQAFADFTFPRAFSASPTWVISAPQSVSSTVYKSAVYSPTATGFRIYINHIHNTAFNGTIEVQVIACGKRT